MMRFFVNVLRGALATSPAVNQKRDSPHRLASNLGYLSCSHNYNLLVKATLGSVSTPCLDLLTFIPFWSLNMQSQQPTFFYLEFWCIPESSFLLECSIYNNKEFQMNTSCSIKLRRKLNAFSTKSLPSIIK